MVLAARRNPHTQSLKEHKVFNNWDVVAEGWYVVCESKNLAIQKALSLNICGQHLVFYRTEANKIIALDGYCPHMGVDLGIGKVIGENIQCFFHHWQFDKTGQCISIPCQSDIPKKSKVRSYHCIEKTDQPGFSIPLSRLVSHGKLLPIWSNSFRNRGPVT